MWLAERRREWVTHFIAFESARMSRPRRAAAPTYFQLVEDESDAPVDESDDEEEDFIHRIEDEADEQESEEDESAEEEEPVDSESSDEDPAEYFRGRDGTKWFKGPPPTGRRNAANILRENGPKPARQTEQRTIENTFALFVTDDMLEKIVQWTNKSAETHVEQATRQGNVGGLMERWRDIDLIELKAFLDCLLFIGISKSRHESLEQLWSGEIGRPLLRATFSLQRFQMLMRFIRFDNKETRQERGERDKLAAFREIWELFLSKCRQCFIPGANVTVDEQLVGFRGRCKFRVYMPMKPDKYGLKMWILSDSSTAYVQNAQIYLGKTGNLPEVGLAQRVVHDLSRPLEGSGRNITCDNFFTSIPLAQSLLQKKLTILGTIRSNKRQLPPEFCKDKSREQHSTLFGFSDRMSLCSYVPKKGAVVNLLSTMPPDDQISDREDRKPSIILAYNKSKGAVDTVDQVVHGYSCSRQTRRWPTKLWFNMIDLAAWNAFVIWTSHNPQYMNGKLNR